jgi:hypothetical protein
LLDKWQNLITGQELAALPFRTPDRLTPERLQGRYGLSRQSPKAD